MPTASSQVISPEVTTSNMADILLIRGGRVIDPSQDYDRTASLMIKEGQIIWLGEAPRRRRTSPFSTPTG